MADGDFDVRTLAKDRVEGGGHTISGVPSNAKTRVVASVTGTYNTGGVAVGAIDLGLTTIDAILVSQVHPNNGNAPGAADPHTGQYLAVSGSDGLLMFHTNASTQAEATDSQTFSCTIVAFGDSAAGAELT
jgi:hypothetical protein